MSVTSVRSSDFDKTVLQSKEPVLVDFWASWCGPCRMLSPIVERVAEAHPEIKVCKVNVDDEPGLAQRYQVSAIPMLALFRGGKLDKVSVGVKPEAQIEAMLR